VHDLILSNWAYFVVWVNSQSLNTLDCRDTALIRPITTGARVLLHWSNLAIFSHSNLLYSLLVFKSLSHQGFIVWAKFIDAKLCGSCGSYRAVWALWDPSVGSQSLALDFVIDIRKLSTVKLSAFPTCLRNSSCHIHKFVLLTCISARNQAPIRIWPILVSCWWGLRSNYSKILQVLLWVKGNRLLLSINGIHHLTPLSCHIALLLL